MLRRFPWLVVVWFCVASSSALFAGGGDADASDACVSEDSELHLAIARNDVEEVRCLLREGVDLEVLNEAGETPLAYAGRDLTEHVNPFLHRETWRDRFEIIQILIAVGANVNVLNRDGWSLLMEVARSGHRPEIYSRERIDDWTLNRWKEVNEACFRMMQLLLDAGADWTIEVPGMLAPCNALSLSVLQHRWDRVELLIRRGVRGFERKLFGHFHLDLIRALMHAMSDSKERHLMNDVAAILRITTLLLDPDSEYRMTPEELDALVGDYGWTPLHSAMTWAGADVLQLLLRAQPAWLNALGREDLMGEPVQDNEMTPLDIHLGLLGRFPLGHRDRENILLLLNAGGRTAAMLGADVDEGMRTEDYVHALVDQEEGALLGRLLFVAGWDAARLDRLLEDVRIRERGRLFSNHDSWLSAFIDNRKKLHAAVEAGDLARARHWLFEGPWVREYADMDALNDEGETPLVVAARLGDEEMVQMLVERGAAIDWASAEERSCTTATCDEDVVDVAIAGVEAVALDAPGEEVPEERFGVVHPDGCG